MAPLLIPRRQTLDSPHNSGSGNSTPRGGRQFDEPLSSNAGPSAAVTGPGVGTAGDSSGPHSQPPTPPSRSSTAHPAAAGVKSHDNGDSSTGHTPPPAGAAASSARDQA